MSTSKHIDRICALAVVLALLVCTLFMNAEAFGIEAKAKTIGYENRLFDTSRVHTLDIVMDDWDGFLKTATSEIYSMCSVVIDGEAYNSVGIRGKGNTSLSSVSASGSSRYSFKIEFDQYDNTKSYHGLDKLCLNNLIQDSTMIKDYLAYRLMYEFGADAPLCSFVWVTVNGEDWGLYLAVEAIEDSFLQRNYGYNHGELYKPDTLNMGAAEGADIGTSGDANLRYTNDNPDSYVSIFSSAKTDIDDNDKIRLVASLKTLSESVPGELETVLDMDEVIRYFVVHNYVVNGDSYTGNIIHNYYLYEEDGKFCMIPWDYNLGYGTFMGNDASTSVNDDIDDPLSVNGNDRPMVDWIYDHEQYTELYHQYFQEFLDTVDVQAIIAEARALISPYVEKDPTKFFSYSEYETGIDTITEFCRLRTQAVANQLAGNNTKVSTGNLNISAMGSMGGGMGSGGGESGGGEDQNQDPSAGGEDQNQNQDPSAGGENQDQNQNQDDSSAGGEADPNATQAVDPNATAPAGDSAGSENGEQTATAWAVSTSVKLDTTATTMPAEDSSANGENPDPNATQAVDPNASQPAEDSSAGGETAPADPNATQGGDSAGGETTPADPNASQPAEDSSAGGENQDPNATQGGDQCGDSSGGGEGGEQTPGGNGSQGGSQTTVNQESKEVLVISVLVLLFGLAVALIFKR